MNNILVSRNGSHSQRRFMAPLSNDIIFQIVSQLDQQDCLTTMAVCRDWYYTIPFFTLDVWKNVKLSESDARMDNQRLERCLGPHVKGVIIGPRRGSEYIQESALIALLQKLFYQWECTNIQSLELKSCITTSQIPFVVLKPLGQHLKHLKILNHKSDADINHILYTFPALTHFVYQRDTFSKDHQCCHFSNVPTNFYTRIVYLLLDCDLTKERRESILRRCPNLRYFVNAFPIRVQESQVMVDLKPLFEWCPKLAYFESNTQIPKLQQIEGADPFITSDRLRQLKVSSSYGNKQIGQLLTTNQGTLEHLTIYKRFSNDTWSDILESLQLVNLHTLVFFNIEFSPHSLISFLNHSPQLESISIHSKPKADTINAVALLSLKVMHQVRYLRFSNYIFDVGIPMLTLLEYFPGLERLWTSDLPVSMKIPRFFESPKNLKYIGMNRNQWNYDTEDKDEAAGRFLNFLTRNSNVEVIETCELPIHGRKSLFALASIPTLKSLDIHIDPTLEDEALVNFIAMLGEIASVETLTLRCVPCLSFATLQALSNMPKLKTFGAINSMFFPIGDLTSVNSGGLLELLFKSPALTGVLFSKAVIHSYHEQGRFDDQLVPLLQQEAPQGTSSGTKHHQSRRWKVQKQSQGRYSFRRVS